MGGIDCPGIWTSVDRLGEVFERLERGFVENVGHDYVSPNGQVRFVDLNVPSEDESPSPSAPVLVHLDVRGVWRATSKIRCMFVHRSLQKKNAWQLCQRVPGPYGH